jgi:hypothetical protein
MNDDVAPETILSNVVAVLEEHTKILQDNRQALEQLFKETAAIKQRLDKLESADSLDSNDAKFLKDVAGRLKAISTTIEKKNKNLADRS